MAVSPMEKAVVFHNICLRCRNKFKAAGRYNRICPSCSEHNSRIARAELSADERRRVTARYHLNCNTRSI